MKLVVDTSILIDYLRGGIRWEKLLNELEEGTEIYLPTIVIFELFAGKSSAKPEMVKKIRRLISLVKQINLTESIAKKAGEMYRDVTTVLDIPDFIIASSALSINAEVITLNRKHFEKIPGLDLYPL